MHATDDGSPDPVAYFPPAQDAQVEDAMAPGAVEYCPGPQSPVHADVSPDADAKLPAAHGTQVADVTAPIADEYRPAPQSVHWLDDCSP